jgi:site-specific recombinase XerD
MAAEVAVVQRGDLQLTQPRQVRLHGTGRKQRLLPLWRETADALHRLLGMRTSTSHHHVFVNCNGQPLTRNGIGCILQKYTSAAAKEWPALGHEHITPHVFRHSCAVALLRSGTDITVIREGLWAR